MRCPSYDTSVMHQIIHFATGATVYLIFSYLRTQNVLKSLSLPTNTNRLSLDQQIYFDIYDNSWILTRNPVTLDVSAEYVLHVTGTVQRVEGNWHGIVNQRCHK